MSCLTSIWLLSPRTIPPQTPTSGHTVQQMLGHIYTAFQQRRRTMMHGLGGCLSVWCTVWCREDVYAWEPHMCVRARARVLTWQLIVWLLLILARHVSSHVRLCTGLLSTRRSQHQLCLCASAGVGAPYHGAAVWRGPLCAVSDLNFMAGWISSAAAAGLRDYPELKSVGFFFLFFIFY